jgi:predicted permease
LSVILLAGAGLLVRSFVQLRSLDPGFSPDNVTTATVSLQDKRYEDAAKVNRLFADTLAQIRRQPGVEAAGVTLGLPYTRLLNMGWRRVEGTTPEDRGGMTNLSYITPGYLEALRVPVRAGRAFADTDTTESMPVAVVNEEFVNRFYRGQQVVGLHIAIGGASREIVGVVGSTRVTSSGIGGDGSPLPVPFIVYVPATQTPAGTFRLVHTWFSPAWVIRTSGSIAGLPDAVRQAVAAVDPLLPIAKIESMADVQATALASQRFMMTLVVGLGAVALLLAAIGIHGLIASSVTERTRELGLRLALGASAGQVMKDVVMPGVLLALVGVVAGAAGALAGARVLEAYLWGVQPRDPLTLLAVVGTLFVVALVASVIPALRVLRLDPALTLRAE